MFRLTLKSNKVMDYPHLNPTQGIISVFVSILLLKMFLSMDFCWNLEEDFRSKNYYKTATPLNVVIR